MNVGFEDYNTEDVAKMFGLSRCTVQSWCRKGFIHSQDVSEAASNKPRYLIPETEVTRIKKLVKKYGKRKWMLYSKQELSTDIVLPVKIEEQNMETCETIEGEIIDHELPKVQEFNPDKIMNTLLYIRDLKERLQDLEAEKNQILGEISLMKREINDLI